MPFHKQPVRIQSAMKRTGRDAVQIGMIFPADRAEPVQIEVRVANFEGIERPLHETDSAAQGFGALKELQHAANAAVAVFAAHTGHVGMQVGNAVTQANNRERVAHQTVAGKCAQHFPAGMRGHYKHRSRLDFQVGFSPNLALEIHATMEFIQTLALPNGDLLAHCFAGVPLISGTRGFPSAFFAASQNASISSRGRFLNSRPLFRASPYRARNLRKNFALAFLSAISGSIFKKRERFTAAKNKSPSSSSIFSWSCSFNAFFNSSPSSCILSKTPLASCQSKPMREALRVNWKPCSVAGKPRPTPSSKETSSGAPSSAVGTPLSRFERRSSALIRSQFLSTSAESFARVFPKTSACRRIILS